MPLRNISTKILDVRLEPSCECAGVEPEKFRIAPGETRRVTVRLDLLHNRMSHAGRPTRPFKAHLAVLWGDRAADQGRLALTGTVRAILNLWPPNLHLKEELVEGEDATEEAVQIKPLVRLSWLVIKGCPPYFQARVERGKEDYTLYVRAKAGLPLGFFSKSIVLQMADAKGRPLPEQVLPTMGVVTGRFVTIPAETTFGIRTVGTVAEVTVRLQGRRAEPFTVVKVTADGGETRVEPVHQDRGQGVFRVRQRILKPAEQGATVSFVVRDVRGKEHMVSYMMRYYGSVAEYLGWPRAGI